VDEDPAGTQLSHTDADGAAHMVDVTEKLITSRVAEAEATVSMAPATLELVRDKCSRQGRCARSCSDRGHHGR